MKASRPDSLAVSVPEGAGLIGVSTFTAWNMVWREELPSARIGRRVVIRRAALEAYLLEREENNSASRIRHIPQLDLVEPADIASTVRGRAR